MARKFWIPADATRTGIDVEYHIKGRSLTIGGWYDSCVGLESETMTLREFFDRLGITEKDCRKAFEDVRVRES